MSTDIKSVGAVSAPKLVVPQAAASVHSPATADMQKTAPAVDAAHVKETHAANVVVQDAQKYLQNVEAVVEQLNKLAVNSGRGLSFKADEKSGMNVITVTNTNTGEVVRTIPTAVAIKVASGIDDFKGMLARFKGLLHDEAA